MAMACFLKTSGQWAGATAISDAGFLQTWQNKCDSIWRGDFKLTRRDPRVSTRKRVSD